MVAGAGRRKPAFKGHVCRALFRTSDLERGAHKKAVKPAVKRKLIAGIREQFGVSERLACRVLVLGRSVYRYQPQPNRDSEIIQLLLELAHGRPEQRIPEVIQAPATLGLRLESQTRVPHLLQSEIEQTTQRQAAAAKQKSGAAFGESEDK